MVTEEITLWEMMFKVIGTFCQNLDHLLLIPMVKQIALGFGVFVVFSKKYLIPKRTWNMGLRLL